MIQFDSDRRRHIVRTRVLLAFMFGVTLSGLVWPEVAVVALVFQAVVWGLWYAAKGDELRMLKARMATSPRPVVTIVRD